MLTTENTSVANSDTVTAPMPLKARGNRAFDRKKERFIVAMLTAPSRRDAARQCQISEATAKKWEKDPEVSAALAELRRMGLTQVMSCLVSAAFTAIQTLEKEMKDGDNSAARVAAAKTVLDNVMRGAGADNRPEAGSTKVELVFINRLEHPHTPIKQDVIDVQEVTE